MAATAGAVVAAMALALVPAVPASAANQSVLTVEITAVDYATGVVQTTAADGTHGNRVAYRVDFSCGVETCTDTTVTITPPQSNPYGIAPTMTYLGSWGPNLLTYNTWTAPAGLPGASIGGDDTTGKIVSLGDVPAGFSGSFLVVYAFPSTVNRAIIPAQLYPEGFEIVHSATIASPNAPLDDSATAAPVVWDIDVPTPGIVLRNPGTVRPDVEVSYQIRMSSGSMATGGGNIYGRAGYSAAGNHTVTVDLPPEAVFVSATGSPAGVYDPVAHTVTWTQGTEAEPTACAGGGWGSTWANTWNTVNPCYNFRYVNVTYPASAFTADPSGWQLRRHGHASGHGRGDLPRRCPHHEDSDVARGALRLLLRPVRPDQPQQGLHERRRHVPARRASGQHPAGRRRDDLRLQRLRRLGPGVHPRPAARPVR